MRQQECLISTSDKETWGSVPISTEGWPTQTSPDNWGQQSALGPGSSACGAQVKCYLPTASIPSLCTLLLYPDGLYLNPCLLPSGYTWTFVITFLVYSLTAWLHHYRANRNPPFSSSPLYHLAKGLSTTDTTPTPTSQLNFYIPKYQVKRHISVLPVVSSFLTFISLSIQHLLFRRQW